MLETTVRRRLHEEIGRIRKEAPFTVALLYPSPYGAAMSSLGYQCVYRLLMEAPGFACERVVLDDEAESHLEKQTRPLSYESRKPLTDFPVIAASVAYEIEIGGFARMLDAAGIPAERTKRGDRHPFVVAGGPLTFSNPLPLRAIADAIVMGEAEELIVPIVRILEQERSRSRQLEEIAKLPHVHVPALHAPTLPTVAKADDSLLPAVSTIRSKDMVLTDMFLIETERGCSRGCQYCVMRRSTNGGMRIVPMDEILARIPNDAPRVGLVGAAVSDHPKIVEIVNTLADRGKEVGLSSLRPDRLTDEFVGALRRGGTRTLTTAMDGPSARLRDMLERRAKEKHLIRAAELTKAHGMDRLKLYLMIGIPTETGDDIDECARFVTELSKIAPVSLGIAPFCAKRNTPLDRQPFAGVNVVEDRLDRLKRGLKGRADVRSTSAKWAWVEYVLAQGGEREGIAAIEASREGGSFAAYRKAFRALEPAKKTTALPLVT